MGLFKKDKTVVKKVKFVTGLMFSFMAMAPVMNNPLADRMAGIENVYAAEATFSEYWKQDTAGNWHVYDNNGNMIKNAWLCDDAVQSNGENVWYLLDENGSMITNALVQDLTGNYYSLETSHTGYFGMLRYQSGTYEGITLDLESNHGGSFAKIMNTDGIKALETKCGLRAVSISNLNCIYTSSFIAGDSTASAGVTPPLSE